MSSTSPPVMSTRAAATLSPARHVRPGLRVACLSGQKHVVAGRQAIERKPPVARRRPAHAGAASVLRRSRGAPRPVTKGGPSTSSTMPLK